MIGGNPGRRVAGRRGPAGSEGPAGPPGPAGSSTVQVVALCASCAAEGGGRVPGNAALGPIAGALIAGLFGLLGLVIAKENKTSDFRQAWIDALRNDIADFTSAARSFSYFDKARGDAQSNTERELEYEKILAEVHQKLVQAHMSIRLRVNPHEDDASMRELNDALLALVEEIRVLLAGRKFEEAEPKLAMLHKVAAPVLKAEWTRVKRGETPYVVSKYAVVVLSVVALLALLWLTAFAA
jgi:hypothetical protein